MNLLHELVDQVAELLADKLNRRPPGAPAAPGADPYRSVPDAAGDLGYSTRTITRWLAAGAPCIGSGRLRRVRVSEIKAWLAAKGAGNARTVSVQERADALLKKGSGGKR